MMNAKRAPVSYPKFPAKILLFGEYTILKGSKGLAFPIDQFSASFCKADHVEDIQSSLRLDDFCTYLMGSHILSGAMDLKQFEQDIKNGLFLQSNIPEGYGIGSSGALCAAVYAQYAYDFKEKTAYTSDELNILKDIMALMENFYHGTSSGLDCLISLVKQPLLIQDRYHYDIITKFDLNSVGQFYLYDSDLSRKTAPFVHRFLEKFDNDPSYQKAIGDHKNLVNTLIDNVLDSKQEMFKNNFSKLSAFQLDHYSDMIPDHIKKLWAKGLETQDYYFKLCGAGGGGFFLVYTDTKINDNSYIPVN
jgi:mevalonate kinase